MQQITLTFTMSIEIHNIHDNGLVECINEKYIKNYNEVYKYFEGVRELSNWHNEVVKDNTTTIHDLKQQINLDKEKIKKLETELEKKNDLLEKYKSLL